MWSFISLLEKRNWLEECQHVSKGMDGLRIHLDSFPHFEAMMPESQREGKVLAQGHIACERRMRIRTQFSHLPGFVYFLAGRGSGQMAMV